MTGKHTDTQSHRVRYMWNVNEPSQSVIPLEHFNNEIKWKKKSRENPTEILLTV